MHWSFVALAIARRPHQRRALLQREHKDYSCWNPSKISPRRSAVQVLLELQRRSARLWSVTGLTLLLLNTVRCIICRSLELTLIVTIIQVMTTIPGGLYMWGADQPFPELSCLHKCVADIFGGHGRCVALHKDGSLYMWTSSCHSPLHLESLLGGLKTIHVALGPTRCIFVGEDLTYWLWDYLSPKTTKLDSLTGLPFAGAFVSLSSVSCITHFSGFSHRIPKLAIKISFGFLP